MAVNMQAATDPGGGTSENEALLVPGSEEAETALSVLKPSPSVGTFIETNFLINKCVKYRKSCLDVAERRQTTAFYQEFV